MPECFNSLRQNGWLRYADRENVNAESLLGNQMRCPELNWIHQRYSLWLQAIKNAVG